MKKPIIIFSLWLLVSFLIGISIYGCGQVTSSGSGASASITWSNTISAICASCHGNGTRSYTDAVNLGYAAFSNMSGVSSSQKSNYQSWANAGYPQ